MRLVIPIDEDRGSVATEYGLTLLLIALVIITAVTAVTAVTAFVIAVRGLFEQAPPAFTKRFGVDLQPPLPPDRAPAYPLHLRLNRYSTFRRG